MLPAVSLPAALRPSAAIPALLAILAAQTACMTVPTRNKIHDDGRTQVILRGEKRGTTPVDRGFQHPVTISEVRMAHILSRIDLRRGDDPQREAAIPLDTLFIIAGGLSKGLAEAGPGQEVVVKSVRRHKKWKVFDRHYLTSLLGYVKDELLYVYISRSDYKLTPRDRRLERLPETHVGKHDMDFRLVVDKAMALVDEQGVAVNWRDPVFKKPTRTRVTSTGKVVRREILMESVDPDDPATLTTNLTPEQLRALADVEEQRRSGSLTEAQYHAARAKILAGEEATP